MLIPYLLPKMTDTLHDFFRHRTLRMAMFLVIPISLLACEKDVVLDLADQEGKYMIVEAIISDNDSLQFVKLSQSSSYYDVDGELAFLNAKVQIVFQEEVFDFTVLDRDTAPGVYVNYEIWKYIEEGEYRLEITDEEGNVYFAKSEVFSVPIIDSLSIQENPFSAAGFGLETFYDIMVHFTNDSINKRHYLFNYFVNDTLRSNRATSKSIVESEVLTDYVSLAAFNFLESEIEDGDKIMIEMKGISVDMFDFYNAFFFQTNLSGNPFAGGPAANIPTNISEGGRGFFQVSKAQRNTIYFVEPNED